MPHSCISRSPQTSHLTSTCRALCFKNVAERSVNFGILVLRLGQERGGVIRYSWCLARPLELRLDEERRGVRSESFS